MKPFDLDAAKRGEPLITRDGRPAKFVAHVPELDHYDCVLLFVEGNHDISYVGVNGAIRQSAEPFFFMAPRKVVKWASIDKRPCLGPHPVMGYSLHDDKADAEREILLKDYFSVARVEFEE